MLQAPRDVLSSLYTGHPKILVVQVKGASRISGAPTNTMTWLCAETSDGTDFVLGMMETGPVRRQDLRPVELPPTNVWAIWNPEDSTSAKCLADWWERTGGSDSKPILVNGDVSALTAALLERALAEVSGLARANQLLIEDMAVLRESWAQDTRLPPELEELVANLRAAPPHLIFDSPPQNGDVALPASEPGLRQRLPVGARGFLGIDLQVVDPGGANGVFEAVLVALENMRELARWQVPCRGLNRGCLPLRLPAALASSERALELRLLTTAVPPPRLSCCKTVFLPQYAYAAPNGGSDDAMLVLKLWGSIPGVKAVYEAEEPPLPANPVITLPAHVVSAVRATRQLTWTWPYFGYLDQGQVLLRPLHAAPASAAAISLPATPGLAAVSCEARIDDGLCKTRLQVRLAIAKPGQQTDSIEDGTGALAATEWIELTEPLKPFRLAARLPEPETDPVEIHFFSRLPEGGTLEHGRVVFGRFETELVERAIWNRRAILPQCVSDQK